MFTDGVTWSRGELTAGSVGLIVAASNCGGGGGGREWLLTPGGLSVGFFIHTIDDNDGAGQLLQLQFQPQLLIHDGIEE